MFDLIIIEEERKILSRIITCNNIVNVYHSISKWSTIFFYLDYYYRNTIHILIYIQIKLITLYVDIFTCRFFDHKKFFDWNHVIFSQFQFQPNPIISSPMKTIGILLLFLLFFAAIHNHTNLVCTHLYLQTKQFDGFTMLFTIYGR